MLWWWVVGVAAWLTAVGATCALLTAAKRADAALDSGGAAGASVEIAAVAVPYVGWLLNRTGDGVVVAVREPSPLGRVVGAVVGGAAAGLLGRALTFDDSVAARAALSGRVEVRPDALAAPLRRMGETIGAIGFSVPPGSALSAEQTNRLLHAAGAINRRLDAVGAAGLAA